MIVASLFVMSGSVGRSQVITSTWIGSVLSGAGEWSNSILWLPAPQPGYNVAIGNLIFPAVVNMDVNATVGQLSLGTGATLALSNGHTLQLNSSSLINGSLTLNATTAATELILANGTITLSGTGTTTLSANANNRIRGAAITDGLINQTTIQGGGSIGVGFLGFTNHGTIVANEPAVPLVITPRTTGAANSGSLRASNGATLTFQGAALNNSGGVIEALTGSTVALSNATITGGVLTSIGTGHLDSIDSTLSGVTISTGSMIEVENGDALTLEGTIVNEGLISLLSSGVTTELKIESAAAILGAGNISLSNSGNNRIVGTTAGSTLLVGANQTIGGAGALGGDTLALTNLGTITANRTSPLVIDNVGATFTNDGTLRATGSGGLTFADRSVTNLGTLHVASGSLVSVAGTFTQSGSGSATTLSGGTFTAGGVALQNGTLDGFGTVNGPVTASGSSLISPGGAGDIGTLAFTSTLELGPSTGLFFDLGGTVGGIGHDQINGTNIALNGSLILSFTNGFESDITNSHTLTLINTSAALNGMFAALPDGSRLTTLDGFGSFQVNYLSNALTISNFQAVPEPSTYVLLTLGALGVLMAERRRRRHAKAQRS